MYAGPGLMSRQQLFVVGRNPCQNRCGLWWWKLEQGKRFQRSVTLLRRLLKISHMPRSYESIWTIATCPHISREAQCRLVALGRSRPFLSWMQCFASNVGHIPWELQDR